MKFLDQETPIAIGQVVIHPDLSSKHVIISIKEDSKQVKLSAVKDWQDVLLWDRYIPTIEELATVIAIKEDVIAENYRNERNLAEELKSVQDQYSKQVERLRKAEGECATAKTNLEEVEAQFAECELMRGKDKHDYQAKINDLEAELGGLRGVAIKNQEDASLVEIKNRQIQEADDIIASQHRALERVRNRLALMMKPHHRVAHQKTKHQFITLIDDVDTAPQDVKIASLLEEGWQITSVNLKPTWLYDEDVKHRTVAHTKRYITMHRYCPPDGTDETDEEVKLPQSMDEAIKAAIGKNDGSHINQLTMPIELADEALYGEPTS